MPRTILIGDIHSCADELFELLEKVQHAPEDTIIAVGDSNSSNEDIYENNGFSDLLILKLK